MGSGASARRPSPAASCNGSRPPTAWGRAASGSRSTTSVPPSSSSTAWARPSSARSSSRRRWVPSSTRWPRSTGRTASSSSGTTSRWSGASPGTPVAATLSSEDQALLKTFLAKLRGGQSKVIITSRSDEAWLEFTNRYEIPLGGLQGEERWDYCEVIVSDLGLTIDRKDADLVTLMDLLGGHPLAMRVILPRLARLSAAALIQALQSNLTALGPSGDPAQDKLFATLHFAEQSLPDDLRPLLMPLALHERFVIADYLEIMAKQVDPSWTRAPIDRFLGALAVAGLLHDRGQGVFEMHPALTGFLRSTRPPGASDEPGERWSRAFVDLMGQPADDLALRELHEQRVPFFLHGANFHVALGEAERLGMDLHIMALLQLLAVHAQNTRNFQEAAHLFERLATSWNNHGGAEGEASAYHQLGM